MSRGMAPSRLWMAGSSRLLCCCVFASACGASSGGVGPPDATADRADESASDGGAEAPNAGGDGDASHSGDVQVDSGSNDSGLEADSPGCPPDQQAPPTIASTSTITFALTNTSSSDRWLLTQSTDCEAFSINGVTTELPQVGCGMYPPERLYFQRLPAGGSASLTWDARGLVLYTTYQSCSPNSGDCLNVTNGSPQPVSPGQYVAQFAIGSMLATGSGTPCVGGGSGDVFCTVTTQNGMPQRGGQCTWSNVSLIQQTFNVPSSGSVTVNVAIQ